MKKSRLSKMRRWAQGLSFVLFCAGILMAGAACWPLPKDLFFLVDPLIGIVTIATLSAGVTVIILSFVMIVLTFIFGRFFCGWFCPLGTLNDFAEWLFLKKPGKKEGIAKPEKLLQVKFGILVMVLVASLFSVQIIYYFDPMVIMTRFVGMTLIPVQRVLLKGDPFTVYHAGQFIAYLGVILILSVFARRYWCRFICPLGALFGIVGKFSAFTFKQDQCKECPMCQKSCPTGAITSPKAEDFRPTECIRCFDCLDACPVNVRTIGRFKPKPEFREKVELPRRTFLTWAAGGLAGASIFSSGISLGGENKKRLLRPPFAPDEKDFLDLCVRCQACVNVCPTNALQPLVSQAGIYGLWSPGLMPSIGACQVTCNRCSEVCPTGAIGRFDLSSKFTVKIGTAHLIKSNCVAYADNKPCGKCITKCPTGAISYREEGNMRFPVSIDYMLCVGCGICENICNKQTLGPTAMIVTAQGRNQPSGADVKHVIKKYNNKG